MFPILCRVESLERREFLNLTRTLRTDEFATCDQKSNVFLKSRKNHRSCANAKHIVHLSSTFRPTSPRLREWQAQAGWHVRTIVAVEKTGFTKILSRNGLRNKRPKPHTNGGPTSHQRFYTHPQPTLLQSPLSPIRWSRRLAVVSENRQRFWFRPQKRSVKMKTVPYFST